MRILILNTVYAIGSTGKIVKQIAEKAEARNHRCMIAHRYREKGVAYSENTVAVSSWWDCHIHNRISRLTMLRGCFSRYKTYCFIKKAKRYNPDLIHLHNINGNYINLPMLFRYIKKSKVKVVWTFHDCWPLTGYCKHFDMIGCDRWKSGCGKCLQKERALIDTSSFMLRKKQKMLQGISDLVIVTPSLWLAGLVGESYLQSYSIRVIHNGIDTAVFQPTDGDFRKKYALTGKKILLGVAFDWGKRKGLDVFIQLAKRLPDDFRIVLVGTNDQIDAMLPQNMISIHRTNNQKELAEIYTAADVFVNPTREENYPTVNMEALACGTPVVTFRTGGSPEIIDETCGCSVEKNDTDALLEQVLRVCRERPYTKEACLKRAKNFNANDRFDEYIQLYEDWI